MSANGNNGLVQAAAGSCRPLLLSRREDLRGLLALYLGKSLLFAMTCSSIVAVLLIFFFVTKEALGFITDFSLLEFITSADWYPEAENPKFGALALLTGSFYVTAASLLFAAPLGILAAIFLSDIVSFRVRGVVKPVIELLAAIPSVAYGFFAVLVLAPWLQRHFGFTTGTNALNASIVLSIMALPTIITVAEDSISAAGRELREGSYSLGATRAETLFRVVIPAAHSGIIAAVVLGMMRAIGETMVVWMASGTPTYMRGLAYHLFVLNRLANSSDTSHV